MEPVSSSPWAFTWPHNKAVATGLGPTASLISLSARFTGEATVRVFRVLDWLLVCPVLSLVRRSQNRALSFPGPRGRRERSGRSNRRRSRRCYLLSAWGGGGGNVAGRALRRSFCCCWPIDNASVPRDLTCSS